MSPGGARSRPGLDPGRATRRWVSSLGLLSLLVASAAGSFAGPQPPPGAPSEGEAPPAADLPDLETIPEPVLQGFEPAAAEQLRAIRREVEELTLARRQESVDALGVLCELYLGFELSASAEACLLQLSALRPDVFRWHYYLAMLYARDARLEEARSSIETALALRPGDLPALLRAGDLYLQGDRVEDAERAYRSVLDSSGAAPGHVSAARWGLGRIAIFRGDAESAAALFEAALEGQPEGSIVHYHLGLALRSLGDVEGARRELEQNRQQSVVFPDPLGMRLKRISGNRQAIFTRGVEALRAQRVPEAIALFGQLLELDPDDAEAHYNLALARIEIGEPLDAELHLRRALEIWPDFFDAHFNLAVLLGRTGRPGEAAEHLDRAVELDPRNLPTRVLRARLLSELGRTDEAVGELEAVLELDESSVEALFGLAAIETERGEPERALRHYERLVMLSPEDPRAHLGRARSLILTGAYSVALEALEESSRRFAEHPALADLLARLLATCPDPALRDGERAVALAERVVAERLTLEHAETLAMALARVGRFDEAVLWQRRVLDREAEASGTTSPERRRRLELYQQGRPVLAPWEDEEEGGGGKR